MNATHKLLKNTNEPSSIRKHCSRCSTLPSVRPSCQRPAVRYSDPRGNDCEDPDTPSRHSCGLLAASSVPNRIGSVLGGEATGFLAILILLRERAERTKNQQRESFRGTPRGSRARALFLPLTCSPNYTRQIYLSSLFLLRQNVSHRRGRRLPVPVISFATLFP